MPTPAPDTHPLLLFDGVCNLCDATVNWIIDHDPAGCFRFAALQSEAAAPILARHGLTATALESVVLVEHGRVYRRSDAVLRAARHLGGLWPLVGLLRVIPRPVRDRLYDLLAAHRYRLFGTRAACRVPTPELRARFL